MAAKKQAKAWYVVGNPPTDAWVDLGVAYDDVNDAVTEAKNDPVDEEGDTYVYRLVPVKIVRRAGVIVEDVS